MPKYINFKNAPSTETPLNDINLMKMQKFALENCYPVGCIYMTSSADNPTITFGFGTWERIKGRMLIGVDETDDAINVANKTGGEKEHTLTIEEMPTHNHDYPASNAGDPGNLWKFSKTGEPDMNISGNITTGTSGNSQPHNNLPPYFTCYIWKRIT